MSTAAKQSSKAVPHETRLPVWAHVGRAQPLPVPQRLRRPRLQLRHLPAPATPLAAAMTAAWVLAVAWGPPTVGLAVALYVLFGRPGRHPASKPPAGSRADAPDCAETVPRSSLPGPAPSPPVSPPPPAGTATTAAAASTRRLTQRLDFYEVNGQN